MGGCDDADRQPRRWKTSTRHNKPLGGSGSDTLLRGSHTENTESSSSSADEEEYVKAIRRRRERLRNRRRLNTILKDEDSTTTTTTTEGEEDDKKICDADDEASSRRRRVVVPVATAGEGGCPGKNSGFVWEYTEQPEPQEVDRGSTRERARDGEVSEAEESLAYFVDSQQLHELCKVRRKPADTLAGYQGEPGSSSTETESDREKEKEVEKGVDIVATASDAQRFEALSFNNIGTY